MAPLAVVGTSYSPRAASAVGGDIEQGLAGPEAGRPPKTPPPQPSPSPWPAGVAARADGHPTHSHRALEARHGRGEASAHDPARRRHRRRARPAPAALRGGEEPGRRGRRRGARGGGILGFNAGEGGGAPAAEVELAGRPPAAAGERGGAPAAQLVGVPSKIPPGLCTRLQAPGGARRCRGHARSSHLRHGPPAAEDGAQASPERRHEDEACSPAAAAAAAAPSTAVRAASRARVPAAAGVVPSRPAAAGGGPGDWRAVP